MDKETKNELIKLTSGALLFIVSLIMKNTVFAYVFLLLSYVVLGFHVIKEALENLFHGELFDENFLMTVATIAAAILGEYNEAVFVMLFYGIGELAQDLASDKSKKNIKDLIDITPKTVHVGNKDEKPENIEIGTVFTVFPGERIPIDGIITKGNSFIDTKAITGESIPVFRTENSRVISGSIVLDSPLFIKSEKKYEDSTAGRILKLIEENSKANSKTEKFITKFAKYYTPVVIILALLLACIPSIITGQWSEWIHRALSFLVISCPCALVLSVPLAFFAGIGGCAAKGILIKGSEFVEKLAKTEAVVFDKTGTLTKGTLEVQSIECPFKENRIEMLTNAYSLEKYSNHPIAKAIVDYCEKTGIQPVAVENVTESAGFGISGEISGQKAYVGNAKMLNKVGVGYPKIDVSGSIVHVVNDNRYLGYFVVKDTIKQETEKCLQTLKELGIKKTVILSGDNEKNTSEVAKGLNIDTFYSELLPEEKTERIKDLKKQYLCTYCGDGINDIPVMLESDTAVSMGNIGSDAAIEASDIVFTNDNLNKLPEGIKRARKVLSLSRQNIAFALLCKVVCLVLGAFGITGMGLAVFADTGVAVLTVLNSMRALY